MDHLGLVAGLQVPEDGGVVEESQVDHVLALLELGRVDPAHLRLLVGEFLVTDSLAEVQSTEVDYNHYYSKETFRF